MRLGRGTWSRVQRKREKREEGTTRLYTGASFRGSVASVLEGEGVVVVGSLPNGRTQTMLV